MNIHLYDIAGQYIDFLNAVENGEIPEEAIADTLEGIDGLFDEKVDNIACLMKQIAAEAKALRAEEVALAERRRAKASTHTRLKEYLGAALTAVGKTKFETEHAALSFRKSTKVNITDIEAVLNNAEYLKPRKFDESEIDKTAVKEALTAGIGVPGAELQTNMNLQVK